MKLSIRFITIGGRHTIVQSGSLIMNPLNMSIRVL